MGHTQPLILFDVGSVLIKSNFENMDKRAQELSNGRLLPQEFLRQYSESGLEKSHVLGNISTPEFLQKLEQIIGNNVCEEELRKLSVSHIDGAVVDMLALKQSLINKGYRVGIFSNATELHYMEVLRRFPEIYNPADPLILSFQKHLAKPDRAMYKLVSDYSKVIFIDDSQIYVNRGITDFSWKGIVYLGSADSSEPQRKRDERPVSNKDIRIAYSANEVRKHLKEFGIA